MTIWGVAVIDMVGLGLVLFCLNQIRKDRLYVGYGALLILLTGGVLAVVSIPVLRGFAGHALHRLFPGAEIVVAGGTILAFLLAYVLTQITLLANRLTRLIQELAIREARPGPGDDDTDATA